jgi:hypothetical protein
VGKIAAQCNDDTGACRCNYYSDQIADEARDHQIVSVKVEQQAGV